MGEAARTLQEFHEHRHEQHRHCHEHRHGDLVHWHEHEHIHRHKPDETNGADGRLSRGHERQPHDHEH